MIPFSEVIVSRHFLFLRVHAAVLSITARVYVLLPRQLLFHSDQLPPNMAMQGLHTAGDLAKTRMAGQTWKAENKRYIFY